MKLTSPTVIKSIMSKNGLKFNKSLGQNFLTDDSILDSIIKGSMIDEKSAVIEIGPGIGSLTQALSQKAGKVVSIELDQNLTKLLNSLFVAYPNVQIIQGDILKTDLKTIISNLHPMEVSVVANLPYYITTPILMRLLEEDLNIKSITVMVQKEVADRITARPSTKDYGVLSIAAQYRAKTQIICNVPPHSFMPVLKVSSAVVRLIPCEKPVTVDEDKFFRIVKSSFAQRRKTLVNALNSSRNFKMDKSQIVKQLEKLNLNEKVRGETLSIQQFAKLSELIK